MIRVLDLFSCVGSHALGLSRIRRGDREIFRTVCFVEKNPFRRAVLKSNFKEIPICGDVREVNRGAVSIQAEVIIGGPPCQETSVASAIHGKRTGASLWPEMLRVGLDVGVEWFVVEQPPGNKAWEAEVAGDLSRAGFHVARLEFAASDLGAPYLRRRVFLLACTSLPRLEVAWREAPQAIARVKGAADARGTWDARKLVAIRVDAGSPGGVDRRRSRKRRERIEALGDSNPPEMAEVIGHCLRKGIEADV